MEEYVLFVLVLVVVLTALTFTVYKVVLVRGNIVRIGLTALTLAVNEVVLVRGNVVGILCAADTLAVNEVVLVRGNVVGIGFAALTLAVYEVMSMRGNVVGILCAADTLAVYVAVFKRSALCCAALTGCGSSTGCFTKNVSMFFSAGKHVENVFKTGDLCELITRGAAYENHRHGKHKKCQILEVLHFFEKYFHFHLSCIRTRSFIIAYLRYKVNCHLFQTLVYYIGIFDQIGCIVDKRVDMHTFSRARLAVKSDFCR